MNLNFKIFAITILFGAGINAQVKVGDNPTNIKSSAALEIESTNKGFLPPRLSTTQRDAVSSPSEGLTIYNTDTKCLNFYSGTGGWINPCTATSETESTTVDGGTVVTYCAGLPVSASGCGNISSITYNGVSYGLAEINGQCWFKNNLANNPSNYATSPTWTNSTDNGWYGYLNNESTNVEKGYLYQWSSAMNGSTAERAQGACPSGFHVPSDCEWMYLEKNLGTLTSDLAINGFRGGLQGVGTKLKTGGTSGFDASITGYRNGTNGNFQTSNGDMMFWSSTTTGNKYHRQLQQYSSGVGRYTNDNYAFAVRCLKN